MNACPSLRLLLDALDDRLAWRGMTDHAASCPGCAERVAAVEETDRLLEAGLETTGRSATPCPGAESLAAWVEHGAGDPESHLLACVGCRADVIGAVRALELAGSSAPAVVASAPAAAAPVARPISSRTASAAAPAIPGWLPQALVAAAVVGALIGASLVLFSGPDVGPSPDAVARDGGEDATDRDAPSPAPRPDRSSPTSEGGGGAAVTPPQGPDAVWDDSAWDDPTEDDPEPETLLLPEDDDDEPEAPSTAPTEDRPAGGDTTLADAGGGGVGPLPPTPEPIPEAPDRDGGAGSDRGPDAPGRPDRPGAVRRPVVLASIAVDEALGVRVRSAGERSFRDLAAGEELRDGDELRPSRSGGLVRGDRVALWIAPKAKASFTDGALALESGQALVEGARVPVRTPSGQIQAHGIVFVEVRRGVTAALAIRGVAMAAPAGGEESRVATGELATLRRGEVSIGERPDGFRLPDWLGALRRHAGDHALGGDGRPGAARPDGRPDTGANRPRPGGANRPRPNGPRGGGSR